MTEHSQPSGALGGLTARSSVPGPRAVPLSLPRPSRALPPGSSLALSGPVAGCRESVPRATATSAAEPSGPAVARGLPRARAVAGGVRVCYFVFSFWHAPTEARLRKSESEKQ